jgi:lipopolysaccharide/colanic/teichoic acid biosynthesis glycosyltransferase
VKKVKLVVKRIFDISSSFLVLVVLFPLILAISVTIWITMGRPVFFLQPRIGHKGKVFNIYKFRTMSDERDREGNLLPDEDRITRIGKFLRSTTMDELPELLNVFLGDMSAVGPRPLLVDYRELYSDDQWRRHDMPPGMAGPVLAGGRNTLSWDQKFERDLWYVDNWSLRLDLEILYKTAVSVIKREGISADGHATMPPFEGSGKENN